MWPETATCIAARVIGEDVVEINAPVGTEDLLELRWRANPRCPDRHAFARRLAAKQIEREWPHVEVVSK